jgi:GNAT superfamily N-acetyltransferase
MAKPTVRPFQQKDTEDVLRIGADTAFFGAPVETYLDDRRLFCDAFYKYYTKYEIEFSWVAAPEGHVVGFLMGCIDTRAQQKRWSRMIFPGLIFSIFTGKYRLGSRTWHYVFNLLESASRREYHAVDLDAYPAHLHINLEAKWRGQGLGRKLIETYLEQLRRLSVPGVHLMTTSQNSAACRLYEHIGFQLLDAKTTRAWERYIPHPMENRCYGYRLNEPVIQAMEINN